MKLMMICKQMMNTKWKPRGRRGNYLKDYNYIQSYTSTGNVGGVKISVMWDANIFVQAKWKRSDR